MLSHWECTGGVGLWQFIVCAGRVAHRSCNYLFYCQVALSCQADVKLVIDLGFFPPIFSSPATCKIHLARLEILSHSVRLPYNKSAHLFVQKMSSTSLHTYSTAWWDVSLRTRTEGNVWIGRNRKNVSGHLNHPRKLHLAPEETVVLWSLCS